MSDTKQLSADEAIAQITRHQKLKPHQEWRITIAICNPGGLTAHQTIDAVGIEAGFDWTARQLIITPSAPLSTLTPEQVVEIGMSVRGGQSWHAYQREKQHREAIATLTAERDSARAELSELREKLEAAEKDARRWQKMRSLIRMYNITGEYGMDYCRYLPRGRGFGRRVIKDDESIDAAIDAAITHSEAP